MPAEPARRAGGPIDGDPRIAVVTGAAGGLGAAIAERLARDGLVVVLVDRDGERVATTARAIPAAVSRACDVTDEAAVEAMLADVVASLGAPPSALVNNAGIVRFSDLLEHSVADFRRVLDVNLVGTFIMARAVARLMIGAGTGGSIVNITSLNAVAPSPDAGAYPCSKAAVAKLTEQMALSFAPKGIRVNSVAPGFIDAGMSAPIYADPAVRAVRGSSVPARRLGTAQDVSEVVAFLISDAASYVHAQHILVDGGVACSLKDHLPRKPPPVAPDDR